MCSATSALADMNASQNESPRPRCEPPLDCTAAGASNAFWDKRKRTNRATVFRCVSSSLSISFSSTAYGIFTSLSISWHNAPQQKTHILYHKSFHSAAAVVAAHASASIVISFFIFFVPFLSLFRRSQPERKPLDDYFAALQIDSVIPLGAAISPKPPCPLRRPWRSVRPAYDRFTVLGSVPFISVPRFEIVVRPLPVHPAPSGDGRI